MVSINRDTDIGYLVSMNGTILPIRPIQVDKTMNRKGNKYKAGQMLYIHDQIIRYYIQRGVIKHADHLVQQSPFQLFCGLTDLGIMVMIRAMHEFNIFLTDHVTRKEYEAICHIQSELNEPMKNIARPYYNGDTYETEVFHDLKTAIQTVNTRYKQEKEEKRK